MKPLKIARSKKTKREKQFTTFLVAIILTFNLQTFNCEAQNNSIVLDGAYIVMDGGTAINNIAIVVDQPNPLGIIRLPTGGHIHSENQYNFVKWLSGATTGGYVFPFGVGGNASDYIPFTFNKTAGNNSISISTWGTNTQNLPKPAATNVAPVTNMSGITDSVVYAIDRFWDIHAIATTADLTFSYRGIENTTAIPASLVQAQHWNGNSWDTPVGSGAVGVTTGIGIAGPFIGQNTFSPWVLIVPCSIDTISQSLAICQGDSVTVGTNTYTTTGSFIDTLTNILGCDSIITTNLTVNPNSTSTDIQTACNSLTWINGITYTTSTTTPIFTIIGGSSSGCDSVVTLNLTIIPSPQLTLFKIDDNCGENSGSITAIVVSSNPPVSYNWNTGSTDSIISNLQAGTYSVTINDGSGCINTSSINIDDLEINCEFFVYVPNMFSPNGDGQNDVFFVYGKGIETLSVKIYNRWGNEVFEIDDINQGWDGKYKGADQNTGVFVFMLEATFLNGKIISKSGDVNLVR
jgi:gliding motility-associated-like protein